jgi:SagB-type dehydrogenase family enzyme
VISKVQTLFSTFILHAFVVAGLLVPSSAIGADSTASASWIKLPPPQTTGKMTVEEAISKRRSIRMFTAVPMTIPELSQLLWSAQGITDTISYPGMKYRAAPSAGALYPLELYAVVGNVTDLAPGIYKYHCDKHELELVSAGDQRQDLAAAALGQDAIKLAPVDFVWTAVYKRCEEKYKERAELYVPIEVGHSAENAFLQATALGLSAVAMGAFYEDKVQTALKAPKDERALYIMPVGHKVQPKK